MKLDRHDLNWAIRRMPARVIELMKDPEWKNRIFVGGGFIRGIIANEQIRDIDLFVKNKTDAELAALKLCKGNQKPHKTDNAYTISAGKIPIQVISRWVFEKPENVSDSFDFTICCAVIFYDGEKFDSYCDDRFYVDLAAKRLVYRSPIRNEDSGGSMLRVLKYYQRGYRIPIDSLGNVIARLIKDLDLERLSLDGEMSLKDEIRVGEILAGLLYEVDPNIDLSNQSHLPSIMKKEDTTV